MGEVYTMYDLGKMYENGSVVENNEKLANEWFIIVFGTGERTVHDAVYYKWEKAD